MAMSEEEWLRCSETNPMFAAIEQPSEAMLTAFNLACCRRVRGLITDNVLHQALDALEYVAGQCTVPADLALVANQVDTSSRDPSCNPNVSMAVGHAVCRFLPPGSFHYWTDAVDNARLVALYCQWAVGRAADPDPDADAADPYGTNDDAEPGLMWVRERAQQAEASAQCDLIRGLFSRCAEPGHSQDAEPGAAPS